MSSLSDILTASKNIAVAINNMSQSYLNDQGQKRSITLNVSGANALVSTGPGRVVSLSVTSGTGKGAIYDDDGTGNLNTLMYTISAGFLGVVVLNLPYRRGLLVQPGVGMSLVVSYSEG